MDADVIVIGAGAAGLMAAGTAAVYGAKVVLLEKNAAPGKKILITGKGRCNLTNACTRDELLQNIPANPKFLYACLQAFSVDDCINFFEQNGVATKVERGNRVFPKSDRAEDVVRALVKYAQNNGVEFRYNTTIKSIKALQNSTYTDTGSTNSDAGSTATGTAQFELQLTDGYSLRAAKIIIATGGLSAPGTGSSGDGYRWAERLGHSLKNLLPSLIPLEISEPWVKEAQGLTLKNIQASVKVNNKVVAQEFGELLFTHFGISGPVVLTLSDSAVTALAKGQAVKFYIDLKPALSSEQLDQRIQRDFALYTRKQYKNSLADLLPKSLIPIIIKLSGIPEDKFIHQITKTERVRLVTLLKGLELTVEKARPIREAVITAGGVNVKELNPKTMESKIVPGLYFAGEIIDVHGFTGGFNLQIAWSTGYAAGKAAAGS